VRSYERALRGRIAKASIARIKVAELQRRDLQRFADDLLASGLSASTVSNIINPIQAFYRWEINRDELTHNPSERIDLPNNGQRRPRRIASPGEAAALLAALAPEDRAVWATAFYAGLRRGELQALRACDIDTAANVIAVERGRPAGRAPARHPSQLSGEGAAADRAQGGGAGVRSKG
jgi:site-specific recombinase XerC